MIQFLGKAIVSFKEKVNFKGMSRYTESDKVHINIFIINHQLYYITEKHEVYPFDNLFNYPIETIQLC